jgi:hypothetical protein
VSGPHEWLTDIALGVCVGCQMIEAMFPSEADRSAASAHITYR